MRFALSLICCAVFCQVAFAATPAETLFVRRVLPLLQTKCWGCHGQDVDAREGGLDLRTHQSFLAGGDSEIALVHAAAPDASPLLLATQRTSDSWSPMPPKEAERLSDEELNWLRTWIQAGAPWPNSELQGVIRQSNQAKWDAEEGIPVATSGGLDATWTNRRYKPENLWAYQPVQKPEVPLGRNPIDWFLTQRILEGISVAPRADRPTLLRRLSFDTAGLPPTPEQMDAFLADPRSDREAFAALVDQFLASPHFGERMAQHWLDVVRYADSSGLANDFERGNAWRYRDYVVRAFNDDKPFDRFILEQIAGDELDPDNPEAIVATGFLRMGPWELTGMEVAKVARQRFLDDVTNSVGEVFLAHSLQCARCHDHKFDPIPTRDYYAIQAVFATTQLAERRAPFLSEENTDGFEEVRYLRRKREYYQGKLKELDAILLKNAEAWFRQHNRSANAWNEEVTKARSRNASPVFNAARNAMSRRGFAQENYPPKLVGFTPAQFGMERVARKGIQRLSWELERYEPFALSVYNGATPAKKSITSPTRIPQDRLDGQLENTCILAGGDPFRPAKSVRPGPLSVLQPGPAKFETASEDGSGKRSALARWIASPDNGLTTRTITNRVWLWHFGRPLAGNPNNFGATGKKPTHPELLDWLAATLVESGWSLKSLHRLILNSEAYARSTTHPSPAELKRCDPLSTSYARFLPRRLSAEELRDAMLHVSGELNQTMGGIPCRPEIHTEVALQPRQVMGSFASAWVPNPKPKDRHRRTIYVLKLRGLLDPLMEVFNAPSPDFSCELRDASTVTPQVFTLFNGRFVHARALSMANRMREATKTEAEAIDMLFRLALGRRPTPDEATLCQRHWRDLRTQMPPEPPAALRVPLEIERRAVEENTGEEFTFTEKLYANEDFVDDLQPHDTDVATRALADICLVIMNSNEFLYVD